MVRANADSHAEGVVVARNPRRTNRSAQPAATTAITSIARRNACRAFMPFWFHVWTGLREQGRKLVPILLHELLPAALLGKTICLLRFVSEALSTTQSGIDTLCQFGNYFLGTKETSVAGRPAGKARNFPNSQGLKQSKGLEAPYRKSCMSTAKELHATSTSADDSNTAGWQKVGVGGDDGHD
jgi:hypothetical protein